MGSSGMKVARLGVLGAGTMGAGIAQVAAEAGLEVLVHDPVPGAVERALERIAGFLARKVEKGQLTPGDADSATARITAADDLDTLASADAVIEAIPEDLDLKREAFRRLDAAAGPEAVLASNTSSLPIARIAGATERPERVIGLHFFNPVPLMRLVEVVAGPRSSVGAVAAGETLARSLGKTTVRAADTPGFVVNRVARPFYLEALRILGEGLAGVWDIDEAVRALGFRMGPFELVDTIGLDVNFAVSQSVFEQFFFDPRYRPHPIQRMLVDAGRLGVKTHAGFYDYRDGERLAPWTGVAAAAGRLRAPLTAAQIGGRVVATLVNEAASAVAEGVASPEDVDTAMRLGTNYPEGPLAWGERIGLAHVVETLDRLHAEVPDGRYRVTPLLRELAEDRGSFFAERRA